MTRPMLPWLALCLLAGCQRMLADPQVDGSARSSVTVADPAPGIAADDAGALPDIPRQEAISERLAGKLVRVIDGDSLVLLVEPEQGDRQEVGVRLVGIATPESDQPWGVQAKQALTELVLDQRVEAYVIGVDRNEQKLARVYVGVPGKQTDVNLSLVAQGLAWHDKRYSDDEDLAEAETTARRERKGLWAESAPVAPWDWQMPDAANTP